MKVKDKFELMYGKQGLQVYNVLNMASRTFSAFELEKNDSKYLQNLAKIHIRSKNETGADIVSSNLEGCRFVRIPDYPLPSFVSRDGVGFINLSVLPSDDISDYSPTDIYALCLYSTALSKYISKEAIPDGIEEAVSAYIFAIIMKIFRKKSGLAGAKELIPKLAFLVWLYTHVALFGKEDDERDRRKIASALYTSTTDMKLDYDFSSTTQFLQAINDNSIISISANKFSTEIINRGDIVSLPMFEDVSRFFASMLSCTIPGSRIFPNIWSKIRPELFKTLTNKGIIFLQRAK